MNNRVVFPGSFDPFTLGHLNLMERALPLFDFIIVAIGENAEKKTLFPIEKRIEWIEAIFLNEPKVSVEKYTGLTVDFCKQRNARYILRGIRNTNDFEYEKSIAQMNKEISGIETIFFITEPQFAVISSSAIRDIIRHGSDASKFLPPQIKI
ncbi:MAG: pantetheine-phosphate adenylyltransferase [Bacteroidales bacterium]